MCSPEPGNLPLPLTVDATGFDTFGAKKLKLYAPLLKPSAFSPGPEVGPREVVDVPRALLTAF